MRFLSNILALLLIIILTNISFASDPTFNNFAVNSTVSSALTNPFEGQGNLYEQIFNNLNGEYEHIGKLQAQKILDNKLTVTGGLNSIGFSYRKPFADFHIALDRSIAPDISSAKWIVTDTLVINIDASKIINKLKDQNAIDINQKNLALFAGVIFQRKFTWQHFANSYDEGLSTHFEKLFFPFMGIKFNSIQALESNEIITKEDSLSINAGGFVSSPLYTGVTLMGGALAKLSKISKMELTKKSPVEGGEDTLLLSFEKTQSTMAGISLSIQADFLKLLRMTLLSYDFNYQLDKSYKIYTQFPIELINDLNSKSDIANEIQNIIKTKEPNLEIIAPYIISEEKRLSEIITHKYNFLLLGGSKESKTQEIEVTSHGILKTFFRHNFEKIKYTEDGLSRLISSFFFRLFNSDLKAANVVSDTKKVTIEYDSTKNLLESHSDLKIENGDSQKLSLSFDGIYTTKKTTGAFGKKYKERARFILERYSGVDPVALNLMDQDLIVAPFEIQGKYQVNTDGIKYFNSRPVSFIFDNFEGLCNEKPKTLFSKFRSLFDNCRRSLQGDYIDYLKDLSHDKITSDSIDVCEKKSWKYLFNPSKKRAFIKNCLAELSYKEVGTWVDIPLMPLKNISQNLVNNIDSKVYYYNLFGLSNVFFYGSFNANTIDGAFFTTYFHEGTFKGLGIVDNYMREENLRAPASIVLDQ
jgi:hypothetical protein